MYPCKKSVSCLVVSGRAGLAGDWNGGGLDRLMPWDEGLELEGRMWLKGEPSCSAGTEEGVKNGTAGAGMLPVVRNRGKTKNGMFMLRKKFSGF